MNLDRAIRVWVIFFEQFLSRNWLIYWYFKQNKEPTKSFWLIIAPFYPHTGFGGHDWIFRPIVEDAVIRCDQLLEKIMEILKNNTDVEKKLFDMVSLLKSEVLELQINDQKFKKKMAELEDERLRLLTCLTVVREIPLKLFRILKIHKIYQQYPHFTMSWDRVWKLWFQE